MAQIIERFNEEYRQMVAKYIKDNDSTVFHNETIVNAKDITVQFLESAQSSVEIMTGAMAEVFYNDDRIKEAFISAARRLPTGAIRIFTVNASPEETERINRTVDYINQSAKKTGAEARVIYRPARYSGDANKLRHFMLVDDKRYRWEFPHKQFSSEPQDVSAEVCCFDKDTVKNRKNFFNIVWEKLGA